MTRAYLPSEDWTGKRAEGHMRPGNLRAAPHYTLIALTMLMWLCSGRLLGSFPLIFIWAFTLIGIVILLNLRREWKLFNGCTPPDQVGLFETKHEIHQKVALDRIGLFFSLIWLFHLKTAFVFRLPRTELRRGSIRKASV